MADANVAAREWRAQVGTNLLDGSGDRFRVRNVGPQALRQRCVFTRDVHLGVEPPTVKGGTARWPFGRFQPEQVAFDHGHNVIALESLFIA